MANPNLKNLIAFIVLMQNGDGILSKSPAYILEKYERYVGSAVTDDEYKWGVDANNAQLIEQYIKYWKLDEPITGYEPEPEEE